MEKGQLRVPAFQTSRSPLTIAIVLAFGAATMFLLPYFVPVSPTVADSYLVGFNNKVCLALFLLFAAGFSWWTDSFGIILPAPQPRSEKPSRGLLSAALLFFLAFTLAQWLLLRHHPAIQEAP